MGAKNVKPTKKIIKMEYMPILSIDRNLNGCPQVVPMPLLDNETAKSNHGQDLEKLKSRGGVGVHEALAIMNKRHYKEYNFLTMEQAIDELNKQIAERMKTLKIN